MGFVRNPTCPDCGSTKFTVGRSLTTHMVTCSRKRLQRAADRKRRQRAAESRPKPLFSYPPQPAAHDRSPLSPAAAGPSNPRGPAPPQAVTGEVDHIEHVGRGPLREMDEDVKPAISRKHGRSPSRSGPPFTSRPRVSSHQQGSRRAEKQEGDEHDHNEQLIEAGKKLGFVGTISSVEDELDPTTRRSRFRSCLPLPLQGRFGIRSSQKLLVRGCRTVRVALARRIRQTRHLVFNEFKGWNDMKARAAMLYGNAWVCKDWKLPQSQVSAHDVYHDSVVKILRAILYGETNIKASPPYKSGTPTYATRLDIKEITPELLALAVTLGYHALDDSRLSRYHPSAKPVPVVSSSKKEGKQPQSVGDTWPQVTEGASSGTLEFTKNNYGAYYTRQLELAQSFFAKSSGRERIKEIEAAVIDPDLFAGAVDDPDPVDDFDDGIMHCFNYIY
ncbi:hypothetical protein JCM5296_007101 [Sporobolomyces johnsonii]